MFLSASPSIFITGPTLPRRWVCICTTEVGLCREWKYIINTKIKTPFWAGWSENGTTEEASSELIAHETRPMTLLQVWQHVSLSLSLSLSLVLSLFLCLSVSLVGCLCDLPVLISGFVSLKSLSEEISAAALHAFKAVLALKSYR